MPELENVGIDLEIVKLNNGFGVRIETGPDHESAVLFHDDGEEDVEIAKFLSLTLARAYITAVMQRGTF